MLRVAIVGFGTVGSSFAAALHDKEEMLRRSYGLDFRVVAVSDLRKGSVLDTKGLDLGDLLRLNRETGRIDGYQGGVKGLDSHATIRESGADVIVEVAWTNLETGEPGLTHIREALGARKHVITSNKGPIALAYRELKGLADREGVQLKFECTVMSGTPAIMVGTEGLAGHVVTGFRGILNGTTNFILTRMEGGGSYAEVLREAQRLGYAEVEPSADVEGWDAAGKAVILVNAVMGVDLRPGDVDRQGITKVTPGDIETALKQGKRVKLVARAWMESLKVRAKVSPELVELTDPLANVGGTTNALTYQTDGLGDVTIIGKGAGGVETGHGILTDLLSIHRSLR